MSNEPVRGRPSQFASEIKNLPIEVTGFIFGDTVGKLSDDELVDQLDKCIVQNSTMEKKSASNVAMALFIVRASGAFRMGGYKSWEDYIKAMTIRHQTFTTSRQADRYVHAVQTFIVNFAYPPTLMHKFHPSMLGEIAQAGVVKSEEDAAAWLRLLETRSNNEIRDAVRATKAQLTAPVAENKQLLEFDPDHDDTPAPVLDIAPLDEKNEDDGMTSDAIQATPAAPVTSAPVYDHGLPPFMQPTIAPADVQTVAMNETQGETSFVIEIIRSSGAGHPCWNIYIKRNGILAERYVTSIKPRVTEMTEDEASELNREKRNMRVEKELKDALGG